jgi:predicted CopG family antitoxin
VPLKILFEELKREKREILSFQEVIREREDYLK